MFKAVHMCILVVYVYCGINKKQITKIYGQFKIDCAVCKGTACVAAAITRSLCKTEDVSNIVISYIKRVSKACSSKI